MNPISNTFNRDCLEAMREFPDNYFQLCIADPPYGINYAKQAGKKSGKKYGKSKAATSVYAVKDWDAKIPDKQIIDEMFRVSRNQIIWGANYMTEFLPPSMGWIFWDKVNGSNDFSDGELAFTSFSKGLRKFTFMWHGMIQGYGTKNKEKRIHPTQKPVALYAFLLKNYAKSGDRILDPFLGSGSSRIAAYDLGFDFWGYELDADYFAVQEKRFAEHIKQPRLFEPVKQEVHQENLLFS